MPDYSTKAPGVYLEEVSGIRPISGVGTALPAFLGLAPQGPTTPALVTSWTQYEQVFGGIHDHFALGRGVYAFLANGGSSAMVVRVGGEQAPTVATATLRDRAGNDALVVTALHAGTAGNSISVEVTDPPGAAEEATGPAEAGGEGGQDGAGPTGDGGGEGPAVSGGGDGPVRVVVRGPDNEQEEYPSVPVNSLPAELQGSSLVRATAPPGGHVARPAPGRTSLAGGSGGSELTAEHFIGKAADRTGLAGLVAEDEVTMVLAPDLVTSLAAGTMKHAAVQAAQKAMVEHCDALKDRMAILDPPLFAAGGSADAPMTVQECLAWRDTLTSSRFSAAYFPWVTVFRSGRQVPEPPSGFVAGAWARNDAEHGVAHPPIGSVRSASGLARLVTEDEQALLNPRGINCLRVFRGKGPVIYGVRTLADDAEWRYLNVRRLFNYIEESVMEGTRFAVFSPNDPDLWARLRRSIHAFLLTLWRDGALVGATPEEAFYVRCDSETNPQDLIDQGVVTVEIGAAPVKPAEFVVIRVRQSTDGSSVSE